VSVSGSPRFEHLEDRLALLLRNPRAAVVESTAGHRRVPKRKSAAIAIPVGAQTGVITPRATDSSMPSLAAPT
jgi:hypothetical protein